MSNPSLFSDPNRRKRPGDANLLHIHSSNDTAENAYKEKTDQKSGNFNPLRNLFEEKRITANDTTENANKEKTDQKQGKHDHWRNLLEEFRDTASQTSRDDHQRKQNGTRIPDDLNGHISKDDTGVRFGKNGSNSDITNKLTIEQKRRAYNDIRMFIENEKLNQLNRKLANDRLRDKGIDPKEFRDTGKKLYDLLQADLDGKMISTADFEIAYKKFNRMVQKLGDTDKKIARNYF